MKVKGIKDAIVVNSTRGINDTTGAYYTNTVMEAN